MFSLINLAPCIELMFILIFTISSSNLFVIFPLGLTNSKVSANLFLLQFSLSQNIFLHISTMVTFFPCMGKSWSVLSYIKCTLVDGVPQHGQTAHFLDNLTQFTILSSFTSYRTHSRFLSSSFTISSMMAISFLIELVHYTSGSIYINSHGNNHFSVRNSVTVYP